MSLTRALREELAHLPVREGSARRSELAAMVRFGGSLTIRGGGPDASGPRVSVIVRCGEGSVARRLRESILDLLGVRPEMSQSAGNLSKSSTYLVEVKGQGLRDLGVLDANGHPQRGVQPEHRSQPLDYLAGAVMVAGRLSGIGKPVHFEVAAPSDQTAQDLASLINRRASGQRVVVKGGDAVGDLLVGIGAHSTFLRFDEGRMRRDLRGRVNRSVNADRANLRRSTTASSDQIAHIQALVVQVGWDGLGDTLREVALTRIANPAATLSEIGELLNPPVGKATVHRRLAKLEQIVVEDD